MACRRRPVLAALITDASGAAYVTVGGVDWGIKDGTNAFIDKLAAGSYTNSTAHHPLGKCRRRHECRPVGFDDGFHDAI